MLAFSMLDASPESMPRGARALRVFVIDDDPGELELIEAALDEVGQVMLTTAMTWEAVQALITDRDMVLPDVILLDIQMPRVDGSAVLQLLKVEQRFAAVPVIVRSGRDRPEDVARAYSLQASAFLMKPMNYGDLLEQMRAFVEFWRVNRVLP